MELCSIAVCNMKSTSRCIAILIFVSGFVSADLEFYPDYQRPDTPEEGWARDDQTNSEYQNVYDESRPTFPQNPQLGLSYLDLYKQADLTWPNVAAQNLLRKQNLAQRINELTRNLEEADSRPQYYFRTHGTRPQDNDRMNAFNIYDDRISGDFVPMLKPNFRILDDIRLNPEKDTSDFTFPLDTFEDSGNGDRETSYDRKVSSDVKVVDDPTEFAYPPSDPRYFEEQSEKIDVKPSSHVKARQDPAVKSGITTPKSENFRFTRLYGHGPEELSDVVALKTSSIDYTTGVYIIAIVAGISAAATVGLIAFGIGWYNLQKHVKNASDVEYPAYGVTGPNKDISPSGDRRLAQSAQMYHYQHQKQQIIAMESRAAANERHGSVSEADSDEENEEGDYTVYECPGLAPTGEMEVKNPLFQDDPTPAQTPAPKVTENDTPQKK